MAPGIVILEVTRVHSVKTPQCWEHVIIQNVTISLCVHATTDKHQRSYAEGQWDGLPRPRSRSERAIRVTLTHTPSASPLLRARRAVFPSWCCTVQIKHTPKQRADIGHCKARRVVFTRPTSLQGRSAGWACPIAASRSTSAASGIMRSDPQNYSEPPRNLGADPEFKLRVRPGAWFKESQVRPPGHSSDVHVRPLFTVDADEMTRHSRCNLRALPACLPAWGFFPRLRPRSVGAIKATLLRDTMVEWLVCSPPTKAYRVQSPAGSTNFRKWESCRTMPLVGGFSRGSLASPAPSFRHCSILTSITLIGSQEQLSSLTHSNVRRRVTKLYRINPYRINLSSFDGYSLGDWRSTTSVCIKVAAWLEVFYTSKSWKNGSRTSDAGMRITPHRPDTRTAGPGVAGTATDQQRGMLSGPREGKGVLPAPIPGYAGVNVPVNKGHAHIPEKTRRPVASFGTIPTYENPGATPPGIEPGQPRWEGV
ncbi:hypothetical protein PR048_008424 [Dryococelus australis]|uniref:Uncharacterized protein n=1 Tax=Dryococelus australis TaxID=614101 RepID=A0ABQ9HX25_9NEOP|nr:hypothetical protein PR048_008424 [Dryococelus australis]